MKIPTHVSVRTTDLLALALLAVFFWNPQIPWIEPEPVPGERYVLIVTETKDHTPALARLLMELRTDETLNEAHLLIVDDDAVNEAGVLKPKLQPFIKLIGDTAYPVLFIVASDGSKSKVLHLGTLPADCQTVVKLVEEHGP